MQADEKSIKAVEKSLGEPAFIEFQENTWKIRTNLLLASVIAVAVVFGDLNIESDSTILGLKFRGLSDAILTNGLIAMTVYLLAHFIWSSFDSLLEWRLRVTGTRVAFVTTGVVASEHADYPKDPRQSTLYNWWLGEAKKITNLSKSFEEMEAGFSTWNKRLVTTFTEGPDAMNIVNATMSINSTREEMVKLQRAIKEVADALESNRIPVSLKRFDQWYALFLRSQNLRWLIVEFMFPVFAGAYALLLLFSR